MSPLRYARLLVVLFLALLVTACAGKPPAVAEAPPEILSYNGDTREDTFVNPDGLTIFGRYWLPVGGTRAVVLLIHGTTMHSGLYDDLGRYLAAHGYAVYGIDLQGWGRSDGIGPRGDVYNHDKYVTDVALVLERLRAEFPDRPVFAFGESLGGTVALLGQVQRRTFFDGLILSAPGYKPNIKLLFFRAPEMINNWGLSTVAWWGTKFERWPLIHSDVGLYMVVKDKELRRQMLDDPYVSHNWLPARYVTALVEANKFLVPRIETVNVPILAIHGDRDTLIPVSSSRELTTRTLSRDTRLVIYEGMGHAAMLQPHRYQAMMDIRRWLDLRTPLP